ncbi:MAG: biotin/lipoyl-binding protein [Bacteroidales bacterium]|nr:biotin/lipoyl-binding protein [Bacteroidales bacterium]
MNKILIANRGEIACRIIRTARRIGIGTVAVYHALDKDSLHVSQAGEAFSLGDGSLADTYLNIAKLIEIAKLSRCDAVHPGYGFLSENHLFAKACADAGLIFIGPTPEAILLMGNKLQARDFAIKSGLPVAPGYTLKDEHDLPDLNEKDFPFLVKAAAGGGGKGMRIVNNKSEIKEAIISTQREAGNYFGDPTVYIEKFIESPRHIEVQVLGDQHGNAIHLFERECSIQRRYQKIIEESPSVTLTPEKRSEICEAAVKLAKTIGYSNAGTIEFLVDKNLNFYFLEMNTRIQVEHPVTEMVTGYDLVEEQILIAAGQPLRIKQEDVIQKGHAIECRIYAEAPSKDFLPSPGHIHLYREPKGANIRVDSFIAESATITGAFDPMISKLVVWGEDRTKAIDKSIAALNDFIVHGIRSNVDYLRGVLQHPAYRKNEFSTAFCKDHTNAIIEEIKSERKRKNEATVMMAALLFSLENAKQAQSKSIWQQTGYWRHLMQIPIQCDEVICRIKVMSKAKGHYFFMKGNQRFECIVNNINGPLLDLSIDGERLQALISVDSKRHLIVRMHGFDFEVKRADVLTDELVLGASGQGTGRHDDELTSPMPGKVIDVRVKPGDEVEKGDILLIIESMKMENNILAPYKATVESVNVEKGSMVGGAVVLIKLNLKE